MNVKPAVVAIKLPSRMIASQRALTSQETDRCGTWSWMTYPAVGVGR